MSMLDSYETEMSVVVTPRIARIDAKAAPAFRAAALELVRDRKNVVVMMSRVEAVDSTGLGCLVAMLKAVPPGAQLRLVGLRPAVR